MNGMAPGNGPGPPEAAGGAEHKPELARTDELEVEPSELAEKDNTDVVRQAADHFVQLVMNARNISESDPFGGFMAALESSGLTADDMEKALRLAQIKADRNTVFSDPKKAPDLAAQERAEALQWLATALDHYSRLRSEQMVAEARANLEAVTAPQPQAADVAAPEQAAQPDSEPAQATPESELADAA